jgi:hypothetical protein
VIDQLPKINKASPKTVLAGLALTAILTGCGVQLPAASDTATSATPEPEPTLTPTPTPTPTVADPDCPAGADLPAGTDPRVCGEVAAGDTILADAGEAVALATPSQNIWCYLQDFLGDGIVECGIVDFGFEPAPAPDSGEGEGEGAWDGSIMFLGWGAATAGTFTGEGPSQGLTALQGLTGAPELHTLEHGQAVTRGTVSCLAQEIGLSCWDTSVDHGFFLSEDSYSVW